MNGAQRLMGRIAGIVGAAIAAVALAWWGLRVHTPAIADDPAHPGTAIASLEQVRLDGDPQWVLIRGRNRHAPIVLFLHGGPGNPLMRFAHAFQRPLEKDFLVVQWDRRGAGKSYRGPADIPHMRASLEVADTIQLIEKLRARFGGGKVILVGHSYGSGIGALVAARRPDLVRAYVGVGQIACPWGQVLAMQDAWLLSQAARRHDASLVKAIRAHRRFDHEVAVFAYGGALAHANGKFPLWLTSLRAPEYSLRDVWHTRKGIRFTHGHLQTDAYRGALMDAVPRIPVPVYFFEGRNDHVTPPVCVQRYLRRLDAPRKEMVWFERSAHFPFLEEPENFHRALLRVAAQTDG
ncbi:MAG: alpha/beta hydrolase [Proteobacteria bacterium]|nr:alpha/beta hydrolase [Pseudomonadota bacterium]